MRFPVKNIGVFLASDQVGRTDDAHGCLMARVGLRHQYSSMLGSFPDCLWGPVLNLSHGI